jgi:PST family polysaccharide transporter
MVETVIIVLFFMLALPWGPAGIAMAWTVSYWTLVIPAFWYAGRPIGCDPAYFVGIVWRYVVAALSAALACTAILREMLGLGTANSAAEALQHIVLKSVLFVILYLCAVTLLHQSFDPLRQAVRLLREMIHGKALAGRWPRFAGIRGGVASGPHASANEP